VTAIIQSRGSRFMSIVFRRRALLDKRRELMRAAQRHQTVHLRAIAREASRARVA
jgi:hypothetical protein